MKQKTEQSGREYSAEFWEPFIVCPHCGDVDYEMCDYPRSLEYDGDTAERDCYACGKVFTVTMCVEYTYKPSLPDGAVTEDT